MFVYFLIGLSFIAVLLVCLHVILCFVNWIVFIIAAFTNILFRLIRRCFVKNMGIYQAFITHSKRRHTMRKWGIVYKRKYIVLNCACFCVVYLKIKKKSHFLQYNRCCFSVDDKITHKVYITQFFFLFEMLKKGNLTKYKERKNRVTLYSFMPFFENNLIFRYWKNYFLSCIFPYMLMDKLFI